MSDTPESIECSAQPLDLSFHPHREHLVAAALVDGTLEVHDFSPSTPSEDEEDENDTILSSIPVHTQLLPGREGPKQASCRAVQFSKDGAKIYTGGSAGDVCVLDAERACTLSATTQSVLWKVKGPHAIQSLHQMPGFLVTGDEQGGVCCWDDRAAAKKPVLSWKKNTDYISGFDDHDYTLLASCADCTLSIFDIRMATADTSKRAEAVRQSDDQEDELLSVQVMKHGKKVVCGTQEGVLAVWSWGTWGDISDRFPGHPASIDALIKVDEDTLLTGCSDGLVRLVQIHPDKLLGVLGDHDGYPIEKLQFSSSRSFVGSVSHDSLVRLWDARVLQDDMDEGGESDEEEEQMNERIEPTGKSVASKPAASAMGHSSDDEWDDMDDEDDADMNGNSDDDDDDSSDDDEDLTTNDKRASRLKTDSEKFFEDL